MPRAYVRGGTFVDSLPPTPGENALESLRSARAMAANQALDEIWQLVAGRAQPETKLHTGLRQWPDSHVGSVSHKGTVVLAACAPIATYGYVGIDLERVDGTMIPVERSLVPEGPPTMLPREQGLTLAFAMKEAFYKAAPSEMQAGLRYSNLRLAWRPSRGVLAASTAQMPRHRGLGRIEGEWVVAAAYLRS